jgi:hypothetical protein
VAQVDEQDRLPAGASEEGRVHSGPFEASHRSGVEPVGPRRG